eukprot:12399818-Karenia_brevis.AAC.1
MLYDFTQSCLHPFDVERALSDKLVRWFGRSEARMLARRAQNVLNTIYRFVPPCVIFCLISSWCNAWCTSRRFQGSGRCQLCIECQGEDSLEHYAVCKYHWNAFACKLKQASLPRSLRRFLCLDATNVDEMIFMACHVFAVKRAVDIRRRETGIMHAEFVERLIWNCHRTAAMYHPSLAKRYQNLR